MTKSIDPARLRSGYTTGSCATAAAKAACLMLLDSKPQDQVTIITPSGRALELEVLDACVDNGAASCAIRKDSGDDPDMTNGMLVYAKVTRIAQGIIIDGGQGVGRVTKPGLDQPVGNAAINSVPRRMIEKHLQEVFAAMAYSGGMSVEISIPGGEDVAARTFNPRLGIVGGLSVLGTSGIVEPMSEDAIVKTIKAELSVLYAGGGRHVLVVPGNIGEAFSADMVQFDSSGHVKCSNYIGNTIDMARELGFEKLLLIGHIGKLVKLGLGMYNTHSKYGDGRMEALCACIIEAGGGADVARQVLLCATTDAAVERLAEENLLEAVGACLQARIDDALMRRAGTGLETAFICCHKNGVFAQSPNAVGMMDRWRM